MKIQFAILMMAMIAFASCSQQSENVTPNGYEITRLADGNGVKPAVGDYAFVHFYAYIDGVLETSTRQQDRMMPVLIYTNEELAKMKETGKANPVYDAVSVMKVGDSISVNVPLTEELRQNPRLATVNEFKYDIVLVETKTSEAYLADQAETKRKQQEDNAKSMGRVTEVETLVSDVVKQYKGGELKDKITTTNSGLKYMIMEEGTGPATVPGKPVNVHYYGVLTDGSMFDNSFIRGQPYQFPLGAGRVIKGWDEGVALLKQGDKALLFIPSELGYGKAGSGQKIPGDSELIFYIEVL